MVNIDVGIAAVALFSGRKFDVFEPFPSFFLKDREIRLHSGYLDELKRL